MNPKKQTHIPYAAITSLAMIIVGVALELAKLSENEGLQWLSMGIMLVGLILNARAFSEANNAQITFGDAFRSGFKFSAICAIIMFLWSWIFLLIFPDIKDRALAKAATEMAANDQMTEEQIEMAINWTKKGFGLIVAGSSMLLTLVVGVICSLVAAAIAKKSPHVQKFDTV